MHLGDLLRRWWWVVGIGAAATAAVAILPAQDEAVYWSRTQIVFLAPTSTANPNALETQSEALVVTAGVVATLVNGDAEPQKYASPDATIVGVPEGEKNWWLRLPDRGGQWTRDFSDQVLLLDVSGPTPAAVRETQAAISAEVADTLSQLQQSQGVDARDVITTSVAPDEPVIARAHGSRARAVGMIAALGVLTTILAVIVLERRMPPVPRPRRRAEAPA